MRQFVLEQGGTPPEQLPTAALSIKQLEKAEQMRLKTERQPSLFPKLPAPSDDNGEH